jgi:hypothetical protein
MELSTNIVSNASRLMELGADKPLTGNDNTAHAKQCQKKGTHLVSPLTEHFGHELARQ